MIGIIVDTEYSILSMAACTSYPEHLKENIPACGTSGRLILGWLFHSVGRRRPQWVEPLLYRRTQPRETIWWAYSWFSYTHIISIWFMNEFIFRRRRRRRRRRRDKTTSGNKKYQMNEFNITLFPWTINFCWWYQYGIIQCVYPSALNYWKEEEEEAESKREE